jgi:hypothetical protein
MIGYSNWATQWWSKATADCCAHVRHYVGAVRDNVRSFGSVMASSIRMGAALGGGVEGAVLQLAGRVARNRSARKPGPG